MSAIQILGPHVGIALRDLVPGWLVPVFLAITRLGNVAVLLGLFVLDYWFGDHRRGAHAIGLALGGMALITALKFFFGAPRPPSEVNVIPIGGYSFPSGHAMTATIGYGILAYDLKVGSKRMRYAVAAAIIALVALSRVVLGVHFVRDILAGVVMGLVFLVAAIALTGRDPRPSYLLAIGIAVVALVLSGAGHDGVAVLGGAVGAAVAWELLDSVPRVEAVRSRLALLVGALPVLAGIGYVVALADVPRVAVLLASAVLTAGILVAPHLVEPLERPDPAPAG